MTAVLTAVASALRRLLVAFFSREAGLAELASGIGTVLWGVLMLTEDPLPTWRSVDLLLRFWDAPTWGWICVALGLGQLAIFPYADRRLHPRLDRSWCRLFGASLLSSLWTMNFISSVLPGVALFAIQELGLQVYFAEPAVVPYWAAAIFMGAFINSYLVGRIWLIRH